MSKKAEPVEADIVGDNPSRDYKKSARKSTSQHESQNSGQKFRESSIKNSPMYANTNFTKIFRINKIVVILVLVLLVCLLGLILKFLVGVLAWLLQFIVVIVAVALVVWLVYRLINRGGK